MFGILDIRQVCILDIRQVCIFVTKLVNWVSVLLYKMSNDTKICKKDEIKNKNTLQCVFFILKGLLRRIKSVNSFQTMKNI